MTNYLKSNNIIEDKIKIGEIPAILFRPKDERELIPTIIFYHGWSSNKEIQRIRGFILASVGYQVIIPDAIYHGERKALDNYGGENAAKYFWDIIFSNIEESYSIINEIILNYNGDPKRIGVMGHSMGGITAAGVFTHNPNLKTLAVLNGSCGWQDSNNRFKEFLEVDSYERELEEKVNKMDPMNNLNLLIDRPIILLHGDSDTLVPIESQELFYENLKPLYNHKEKLKIMKYLNLNHFVTTDMMEQSIAWFYKYLLN
ncbi:alpha/beta fold hydrolase [Tissierella pigra]|uniref:Alpha/beta fold hydrolase n=1 Tax=Tissierella pigra TaxID=2607614 RepID=A0A6N7XX80_9FIRM|nr:alpha/beta fold hydrolase [Tissierella pigra]MSU00410.1 alpha/beta fold hydrolase [Tissierella pigra]